jgi:hypothetical protein
MIDFQVEDNKAKADVVNKMEHAKADMENELKLW